MRGQRETNSFVHSRQHGGVEVEGRQDSKRLCLTISPAVDLGLQPLDGVLQGLVLLFLLLVLPLPLLRSQLQVNGGGVPDGLGTVTEEDTGEKCESLFLK